MLNRALLFASFIALIVIAIGMVAIALNLTNLNDTLIRSATGNAQSTSYIGTFVKNFYATEILGHQQSLDTQTAAPKQTANALALTNTWVNQILGNTQTASAKLTATGIQQMVLASGTAAANATNRSRGTATTRALTATVAPSSSPAATKRATEPITITVTPIASITATRRVTSTATR